MSIKITWEARYQLWECVARDTSRPVLTYIHIDPKGWAVAADGFILCAVPVEIEKGEDEEFGGVLVPAQLFKTASAGKRQLPPFLEVDGTKLWTYDKDFNRIEALRGEGTYPNWRSLLPGLDDREDQKNPSTDTVLTNLDTKLLSALVKGLGLMKSSRVTLKQPGENEPIYVHDIQSPEALGLIMPVASKDSEASEKFGSLVRSLRN